MYEATDDGRRMLAGDGDGDGVTALLGNTA
jgi:hypothetical protein